MSACQKGRETLLKTRQLANAMRVVYPNVEVDKIHNMCASSLVFHGRMATRRRAQATRHYTVRGRGVHAEVYDVFVIGSSL